MNVRHLTALVATTTLAVGAGTAGAANRIALVGQMGQQGVLVIDGRSHRMSVGESAGGVKLISLDDGRALVESSGQRITLGLGASPVNLGGVPSPGTGTTIVLTAGSGGHFTGTASINGRPVRFMVDTGASTVALSQAVAERIGLRWRDAPRAMARTANGTVAVHLVRLQQVRIGDVQVSDVEAVVVPAPMDEVLLGNSFLSRFSLRRDATVLTLVKTR